MAKFSVPDTNESPDLTPMIDVVFLLIVFFMVVAQRLSEQYIELSGLPIAGNSSVKEEPPSRTIISIDETPYTNDSTGVSRKLIFARSHLR